VKIGFIGDIVGRPGRTIIAQNLQNLRQEYGLDFVIANYENASHGFGLTLKNCEELLGYGIDFMTGGNHSFDKKEIIEFIDTYPLLRPINYPPNAPGKGLGIVVIDSIKVAIINLMGHYTMPLVDNPFTMIERVVEELHDEGITHIIIDIHAEASSEKRALLFMLGEKVSAIFGTHTHVGTDDLQIVDGCAYVSDVGLTGCRDNVIGMKADIPIARFTTGLSTHFDVPEKCKTLLQMVIVEIDNNGRTTKAHKIKCYDDGQRVVGEGRVENK
jgi:2',3'-cyclic-nucleotide 2'-phosphodiesterase